MTFTLFYFSIHAGSAYTFTVNYKLQLTILNHIGHIAKLVGVQGNDLDRISSAVVPYLNSRQPQTLQTVSKPLYSADDRLIIFF